MLPDKQGVIMGFIAFMSSTFGRWARVIVGLVLAIAALMWGPILGIIFVSVGILLIAVGASDTCLFAPLFGRGLNGNQSRR